MTIEKLTGGTVIGVDPNRLALPLYGDKPGFRVGTPGTIFGNVGMGAQFAFCARAELQTPEAMYAKVVFRHIGEKLYLLVAPAKTSGADVYELKYDSKSPAPIIRQLKALFEEAKITLRPDIWYVMETKVVQDEMVGMAVAGIWTDAQLTDRGERRKDVAAGQKLHAEGDDEPEEEVT